MAPRPSVINGPVAVAAGACFAAGDSIRRVADTIGVQPMSVLRALERGRAADAPEHLQRMAERYDEYQADEARREARRERLRTRLANAAGRHPQSL